MYSSTRSPAFTPTLCSQPATAAAPARRAIPPLTLSVRRVRKLWPHTDEVADDLFENNTHEVAHGHEEDPEAGVRAAVCRAVGRLRWRGRRQPGQRQRHTGADGPPYLPRRLRQRLDWHAGADRD